MERKSISFYGGKTVQRGEGSADAAGCLFRSSEFLDAAESKPFRGACSNFKVAGLWGMSPALSTLSFDPYLFLSPE